MIVRVNEESSWVKILNEKVFDRFQSHCRPGVPLHGTDGYSLNTLLMKLSCPSNHIQMFV
jgi:hypothetical protein